MSVTTMVQWRADMKRYVIAALLLAASGIAAHADTSIYDDIRKQHRGDDALHVDAEYCDQRFGAVQNGDVTSPQYKKCKLSRGWRYRRTDRQRTWIDPDTGDRCRDIGDDTSWCSNF
jgi:hypothetical protein